MVELRDYQKEIVEQYAEYRNNSIIFDNGYDKVPNPFTLKDAKIFFTLQFTDKPARRKLIY